MQLRSPGEIPQFVADYLKRATKRIYSEQEQIAAARIYSRRTVRSDNGKPRSRSGALMAALRAAPATINAQAAGVDAFLTYPLYIRFLDMRRFGNHKIYNRPIWGILYQQTFVDLKFDLAAWLGDSLMTDLSESYKK